LTVNKPIAVVPAPTGIPSSITLGTSVSGSVTVSGVSGGPTPTGTVNFQYRIGAGSWITFVTGAILDTTGTATFTGWVPSSVGTYSIQAIYSGDSNYNAPVSAVSASLTVNPASTSSSTSLSSSSITLGGSVTNAVSITTSATGTLPVPSGVWTLYVADNVGMTGRVIVDSGSLSSALPFAKNPSIAFVPSHVGVWYFQVSYAGDANYVASSSTASAAPITVNKVDAMIDFGSLSAINIGGSVAPVATVHGPAGCVTPTGSVTFRVSVDSGVNWATWTGSNNVALVTGVATAPAYTPSSVGSNVKFQATYVPGSDSNYNAPVSAVSASLTVNPASTSSSTSLSSSSITLGGSVTNAVSITTSATGTLPVPSGVWTLYVADNVGMTGRVIVDSGSLSSALPFAKNPSIAFVPSHVGVWYFQVSYAGDANYVASSSTASAATLGVTYAPQYVYSNNAVHDTNVGTHNSFPAMQAGPDGIYDALTEANTASVISTTQMGTTTNTGTSYTTIGLNQLGGQAFVAPVGSVNAASVTFFGRTSAGTFDVKAIITDDTGHILGVSNPVSCSTSAASRTATFATSPTITAGQTYWVLIVSSTSSFRLYYVGSTGGNSIPVTSNSYSTPTDPTGASASGTVNYRAFYATVNILPTAKMGTTTDTGTSYTTIGANQLAGQAFVAPTGAIDLASITFYGATSSGTFDVKAIITDGTGHILANGVSSPVSCSNTAASRTATFVTSPTITAGQTYWILIVSSTSSFRLYYVGTTGGNSVVDASNSYATPTDPSDVSASGTVNYRAFYATVNLAYNPLDLEVQFSGVTNFAFYTQLQINTGALDSENLYVYYWSGSAWVQFANPLVAGLNTYSVSLTSDSLDLKFVDESTVEQLVDISQSVWQIDFVRLVMP
jgi:hypothetical protein